MNDEQRLKYSAAQAFEAVLRREGHGVMLGGGGGASAHGGPRDIKDLDYKMSQQLRTRWLNDGEWRLALVMRIKSGMQAFGYLIKQDNADSRKQLRHVLRLTVTDKLTGKMRVHRDRHKVTGRQSIDISLTTTGLYPEPRWAYSPRPGQLVQVLDPTSMILDKVFVLAQRKDQEQEKIYTDFIDLDALLRRFQARLNKELGDLQEELRAELDMRLQGFGKSTRQPQVNRYDFLIEVVRRVRRILPLLLERAQGAEVRDPRLRVMEVKFMIQRLLDLTRALEKSLPGLI